MTGTTTCAVGERDGQVVLQFPESVQWAAFDPETARQIGEAMAKEAYTIRYGRQPQGKSVLADEVRQRLLNRATIIIRSLQEKGRMPGFIAMEVVDAILQEVT